MVPDPLIKLLVKELDVSDFAQQAYAIDRYVSISMAASNVDKYLAEAVRQQQRMHRGHRAIHADFQRMSAWIEARPQVGEPPRRSAGFPFTAIHFYANCWTIIGRHLTVIRDLSELREVGRALRPHVRNFERYTALRDHYEHLDDRLPGRRERHRVVGQVYGLMTGNNVTFGNRTLDVGPRSLDVLRTAARDVQAAFKKGAIARLEREHPERLRLLMSRAQGSTLTRAARKFGRPNARRSG